MDNDKTIGRGNTSGSSPVRSTPTAAVSSNTIDTPQNNPLPPPSTTPPPTTTATTTNPNNNTVWPTVYNQYELSNRIGQGAFASVWRARIKNTSLSKNNDDDGACDEKQQQQQVECAIKIMDLEHVNINISGEFFFEHRGVLWCYCWAVMIVYEVVFL